MEPNTQARLEKLQTIRTDSGNPVVLVGENPVLEFKHAIEMVKRADLIYRWSTDGKDFQYRIYEPSPVKSCPLSEACDVLCTLVELKYFGLEGEPEIEEVEPTPEYAEELEAEPEPEEPSE
ncbi:MAG: hypothetical protein ACXACG_15975 [Candidatus Thorarchaeota archaeon]|jgi:hypothetical protein